MKGDNKWKTADLLEQVLMRDEEFTQNGTKNLCYCPCLNAQTEREYNEGRCPHQRARKWLDELLGPIL